MNNCLAVVCALVLSVTRALAGPAAASAPSAAPAPVRAGETLDIRVAGEPTLTKSYAVDASGRITLDLIGQVQAVGRTPDQIAAELQARLKEYLKEPEVTVVDQAPSQESVIVAGEVVKAGVVALRPGDGLMEALAAVGGLTPNADGAHATVQRRGQAQLQSVNLAQLLDGDLKQNLVLNDGDVIRVPRLAVATYQVEGEVRLPGMKALPPEGAPHVLEVLSNCGLTDRADRNRIVLTRKGQSAPITIDLDRVLAGDTSANVLVQPGDVLMVASRMEVQVAGAVKAAGAHLLRNGGTLMEAILFAGGFNPDADRTAIEITHHDGTMEKASLAGVTTMVGGPVLRPGDVVLVKTSRPGVITLFGAVKNAGSMPYRRGMTITDVLMDGGLDENAKWKAITVIRGEDGPNHQLLNFNLEAYLKSPQTQNIALEPGDRIVVQAEHRSGTSAFQRLLQLVPLANLFFLR